MMALFRGSGGVAVMEVSYTTVGGKTETINIPAVALVDGSGNAVSSTSRLPVDTMSSTASTDRSGTITTGGTQQQLMPANATRRGLWIQNQSTGPLYINGLANAVIGQPSMMIPVGAYYESPASHVGTGAISIIGATTAQAFAAREW